MDEFERLGRYVGRTWGWMRLKEQMTGGEDDAWFLACRSG